MAISPSPSSPSDEQLDLAFTTELAVELHCDACVAYCKDAIRNQPGVESYEISLKDQRVTVTGKVAPSRIARALKKDGRQVIVKGTGTMDAGNDGTEAAVCIFESYTPAKALEPGRQQDVHGIARMVQVGKTTLLDLTIRHDNLAHSSTPAPTSHTSSSSSSSSALPTNYGVYIAKTGDISSGAASTGGVLRELGQVELRKRDGYGDLFTEVSGLNIWEIIGRAMVIAPLAAETPAAAQNLANEAQRAMKLGPGILAGVIARSAGAWTNDKTVCTCSGKTQWEEAKEAKI